jgi:hypothetical protein
MDLPAQRAGHAPPLRAVAAPLTVHSCTWISEFAAWRNAISRFDQTAPRERSTPMLPCHGPSFRRDGLLWWVGRTVCRSATDEPAREESKSLVHVSPSATANGGVTHGTQHGAFGVRCTALCVRMCVDLNISVRHGRFVTRRRLQRQHIPRRRQVLIALMTLTSYTLPHLLNLPPHPPRSRTTLTHPRPRLRCQALQPRPPPRTIHTPRWVSTQSSAAIRS